MENLKLPVDFANTLTGRTCFVSRIKKGIKQDQDYPLFTLHQIVYKILHQNKRGDYYTKHLSGDSTYKNIEHAVSSVNGQPATENQVNNIYHKIRSHKNHNQDLIHTTNGTQYLHQYQELLGNEMDWEDSMHVATWMLNQESISSLYKLSYQNLVLIKPELLSNPRNKSSKDFFLALCKWISNYTNWNIYTINDQGTVHQYIDNHKFKVIQKQRPTNRSLLLF